jgi:uncharacterized protein YciI
MARMYAVTVEHGPAWDDSRGLREQDGWDEHAAFMDALADEGFIVFGGPLGDNDERFMFAVEAPSAEAIHERLAADPWVPTGQLTTVEIQPWQILLRRTP